MNVVRAFRVARPAGARAITFCAPGPCSARATAAAAAVHLEAARSDLARLEASLGVGGEGSGGSDALNAEAAAQCQAAAEAVAVQAAVLATVENLAAKIEGADGHDDADCARLIDPQLSPLGEAKGALVVKELLAHLAAAGASTQPLTPLEQQRRALLARAGQKPPGAVDLIVSAPLSSCLATATAVCAALEQQDGERAQPAVRVDPKFTATAVVSKATGQTPEQRHDAQQPSRKGRGAASLMAEFGENLRGGPSSSDSNEAAQNSPAAAGGVQQANEEAMEEKDAAEEVDAVGVAAPEDAFPQNGNLRYPRPRTNALAARGWDWAPLTSGGPASWRQSSNPEVRPGWFHPQRLEGGRCDEALHSLTGSVPHKVLVVAPSDALSRFLGVPSSLLDPASSSGATGGSRPGSSKRGATSGRNGSGASQPMKAQGLVRRQVGPEYTWATPFVLISGRVAEPTLVRDLLAEPTAVAATGGSGAGSADSGAGGLPSGPAAATVKKALATSLTALLRDARGFVGWAVHFEHDDNGEPPLPGITKDDDSFLLGSAVTSAANKDDDEGYESFGRTFEVKGVLHLTWVSLGHAEECERTFALAHALHCLLAPLTIKDGTPAARAAAAYAQATAAAAAGSEAGASCTEAEAPAASGNGNDPTATTEEAAVGVAEGAAAVVVEGGGEGSAAAAATAPAAPKPLMPPKPRGQYCAQVDKWPLCLPGQGNAVLFGGKRFGCEGRATLFVKLKFRTLAHVQQGRKLYRDLLLEPLAGGILEWPGFLQTWLEVDDHRSLGCRVTLLFANATQRDACYDELNEVLAQPLAPLSKPGSLVVGKGRTAAPCTLPDASDNGLYDDGAH